MWFEMEQIIHYPFFLACKQAKSRKKGRENCHRHGILKGPSNPLFRPTEQWIHPSVLRGIQVKK